MRTKADWTRAPNGRSNSSKKFLFLVAEIEALIRSDAYNLIGGRAENTAVLILARLAHTHGMRPAGRAVPRGTK